MLSYPNPFTKETTIKLPNAKNILKAISLFDYLGKELKVTFKIKNNNIIIERGHLPKGIYMLSIKTDNFSSRNKLIIN